MFRGYQSQRKIIYIDTPCYWQHSRDEKTSVSVYIPSTSLFMSLFYRVKSAYVFLKRAKS